MGEILEIASFLATPLGAILGIAGIAAGHVISVQRKANDVRHAFTVGM